MFLNLLQLCSAYSCYLTLRERQVWFYMIMLLVQVIYAILTLVGIDKDDEKKLSSMQFLGKLISVCICVIVGWLVGKAYYDFRKSGGLHGSLPGGKKPLLFEDKVAGYAAEGSEFVQGYVNDVIDKENADEKYRATKWVKREIYFQIS